METERIERLGILNFYGYSMYTQEVKKLHKTVEEVKTYIHEVIEMPDETGQKINLFI